VEDAAFSPFTERSSLDAQYGTDANLAARQSVYAYQRPRPSLPAAVLDLAALAGDENVADIGCGNGPYLAELARRKHRGAVLGADRSPGMLRAAGGRAAPSAGLIAADAAALPLRDDAADVCLAMHMLYHVPDPLAAVRELRRVTRPGGRVLIVLNGEDHLRELRDLVSAALAETGAPPFPGERVNLDDGADLLAGVFATVTRHDFTGELLIPGPEPVAGYVRSMYVVQQGHDPESVTAAVVSRIPASQDGAFRVRTHTGCLIAS
jgi:SAM-dependent methyltransferase